MNFAKNQVFIALVAIIIFFAGLTVFNNVEYFPFAKYFPPASSQLGQASASLPSPVYENNFNSGGAEGKAGAGKSFSGAGDVVEVAGFSGITGASNMTVAFWMKPNSGGKGMMAQWGSGRLLDLSMTGPSFRSIVRYGASGGGGSSIEAIASGGEIGAWQHVAVVFTDNGTSNSVKTYKNGVQIGSTAGNGGPLNTGITDSLKIGVNSSGVYFDGLLDEVKIYSTALSESQIAALVVEGGGSAPTEEEDDEEEEEEEEQDPGPEGTFILTASKTGTGSGTVTANLPTTGVTPGTAIILTATVGANSTFFGWSGGNCSGAAPTCTVTVTANTTVTARFDSTQAPQQGTVTPTPGNITYYASESLGNDSNVGTESAPFKTLQRCADVMLAGNTCVAMAGNYARIDTGRTQNGTAGNPITYSGRPGAKSNGFYVRGSYYKFEGFEFRGSVTGGDGNWMIQGLGRNIEVANNTFTGPGKINTAGMIKFEGSNSHAHHNKIINWYSLYSEATAIDVTYGENSVVENNFIKDTGDINVFRAGGNGHIFRNNVVDTVIDTPDTGTHIDFIQSFGNNSTDAYDILLENNIVTNMIGAIGQIEQSCGLDSTGSNGKALQCETQRPDTNGSITGISGNVLTDTAQSDRWVIPSGRNWGNNHWAGALLTIVSGQGAGKIYLITGNSATTLTLRDTEEDGSQGGTANLTADKVAVGDKYEIRMRVGWWTFRGNVFNGVTNSLSASLPHLYLINNTFVDSNVGFTGGSIYKGRSIHGRAINNIHINLENINLYAPQPLNIFPPGDNLDKETFYGNFNYASNSTSTWTGKRTDCTEEYHFGKFCEVPNLPYGKSGINGGNPQFINRLDIDGADNIYMTKDDGLKPTAVVCGKGQNGLDIGAYSCDPNKVFVTGSAGDIPNEDEEEEEEEEEVEQLPPGSTLYVAKNGLDTNSGTQTAPFLTISKCVAVVTTGKTCLVQPGTYDESPYVRASGVTIKSAIKGAAIARSFRLQATNVTIDGFTLTRYDGINSNMAHIRVEPESHQCKLLNNTIKDGIYLHSKNFTFDSTTRTISIPASEAGSGKGFEAAGFKPGVSIYIGSTIQNRIANHDNNGGTAANYQYQTKIVDPVAGSVTPTSIRLRPGTTVISESGAMSTIYVNSAEKNGIWGIQMVSSSQRGQPNNCTIKGNTFSNLAGKGLEIQGNNHTVESNVWEDMNGWRMIFLTGSDNVFRYNVFKDSPRWEGFALPPAGSYHAPGSGSWDMYDTFLTSIGAPDQEVSNNLFEYNFIHDIDEQFASVENTMPQLGVARPNIGITFKNNVFYDIEMSGSFTRPQSKFYNNTFYKSAWRVTDVNTSPHMMNMGASNHGNPVGSEVFNNIFLENGAPANPVSGWYSTRDSNGQHTPGVTADYNYIAGANFAAKQNVQIFGLEAHSTSSGSIPTLNGGDPGLQNLNNVLGPDGKPFTLDDGLKPRPTSKLCGRGKNGVDIGAYSCATNKVFSDGTGSMPTGPVEEVQLTVSAILVSLITNTSATIAWSSSEAASTQVQYGLTTAYGNSTTAIATPLSLHTVVLTGLTPGTVYNYRVISTTAGGKSAISGNQTFTTTGQAPVPVPAPTNVSAVAVSPTQIDLTWTGTLNDANSNSAANYYHIYRNTTYLTSVNPPSGTLAQNTLVYADRNLAQNTRYNYIIRADDGRGNVSASSTVASATTLTAPDNTAPMVTFSMSKTGTIAGSAVLTATASDNVGIVGVQFKLDGFNLTDELTTAPYAGTWNTTGVSNGPHTLVAVARDAAGNRATSTPITVTVYNAPVNQTPVANAGNDQTVVLPNKASLEGTALDPENGQLTYSWSRTSGPAAAIISPTSASTSVTFTTAGTYVFTLAVSDGNSSGSDAVVINVQPAPVIRIDTDKDGIYDDVDKCTGTPESLRPVNSLGCPLPRMNEFSRKTNLSNVDLNSVNSFEIGNSHGKVTYNSSLRLLRDNGKTELNIDGAVDIQSQSFTIRSGDLPELNKKATITLYNVTHARPRILKDGVKCTNCLITAYRNGDLSFTVPSFSTYTVDNASSASDATPMSTSMNPVSNTNTGAPSATPQGSFVPSVTQRPAPVPVSTVKVTPPSFGTVPTSRPTVPVNRPVSFVPFPLLTPEGGEATSTPAIGLSLRNQLRYVVNYVAGRILNGLHIIVERLDE